MTVRCGNEGSSQLGTAVDPASEQHLDQPDGLCLALFRRPRPSTHLVHIHRNQAVDLRPRCSGRRIRQGPGRVMGSGRYGPPGRTDRPARLCTEPPAQGGTWNRSTTFSVNCPYQPRHRRRHHHRRQGDHRAHRRAVARRLAVSQRPRTPPLPAASLGPPGPRPTRPHRPADPRAAREAGGANGRVPGSRGGQRGGSNSLPLLLTLTPSVRSGWWLSGRAPRVR